MTKSRIRGSFHCLRTPLYLAMASGCLMLAGSFPAAASVDLTSEKIFNFDFTSPALTPPPPYDLINFAFSFGGASGAYTFYFYSGLNGAGSETSYTSSGIPTSLGRTDSGLLDGIFSVGIQSNSLLLNSISASAFVCGGNVGCVFEGPLGPAAGPVTGTLMSTSVPEPASLALLGIAMAGLVATRRKPRH